jgi:ureidoglycolate hydrolase
MVQRGNMVMVRTIEIPLARLSAEAFAPFGHIIGAPAGAATFAATHLQAWPLAFEAAGSAELMLCRYLHQPYELTVLERHPDVTQAFIPLGDAPSVMVVAPPTGQGEVPDPTAIRAFHAPGNVGMMLRRGTWHAVTRFPVDPKGATFVMVTDRATQRELEAEKTDGTPPTRTQVVDYGERLGLAFRVVDPERLLAG